MYTNGLYSSEVIFRDTKLFVQFYNSEDIEVYKVFAEDSWCRIDITNMFNTKMEQELIKDIEEQVYRCNLDEFDRPVRVYY